MPEAAMPVSSSPSITILVSSVSARGLALRQGREAVRILRAAGWQVDVVVTTQQDEIGSVVTEIENRLIGAVGGDGYLASVAEGITKLKDRILVPFPGGRGNDLCRSLGIGTSASEQAESLASLDLISLGGRIRSLDGMWVKDESKNSKRLALGVVSFGIDAHANLVANRSWFRSGPLAYAWGAMVAFVRYRFQDLQGTVDGTEQELTGWLTSISNTGWFGGGINVVPQSNSRDGLLEIVNVGRTGRWKVVPLLFSVLGQRNLDSPLVHLYEGKEIVVSSPHGFAALADGDIIGQVPLRINVAPNALQVLI